MATDPSIQRSHTLVASWQRCSCGKHGDCRDNYNWHMSSSSPRILYDNPSPLHRGLRQRHAPTMWSSHRLADGV